MATVIRRLSNKVAVITGGASGIGAATARLFVANGAKVIIADIQDEKGEHLAGSLGGNAEYVHCDVAREDDIATAVDQAISKYGRLDVMFNNAGICGLHQDPFPQLNVEILDRVYGINVRGVALGVKHAARVMVPSRKGCILCTGSISSVLGCGMFNSYTISKHAVVGIVKAAASELGKHGIRVNSISPGAIPTPMLASNLAGATLEQMQEQCERTSVLKGVIVGPEDIANTALFLASEEGRYISGHNLFVDGAATATLGELPVGQGA